MVKVETISEKQVWEDFILSRKPNIFLQSWNWGEVRRRLDEKIFRLGFWENSRLLGVALLVKKEAKRGDYLACPGGPLLDWQQPALFAKFVEKIRLIACREKVVFARVRPSVEATVRNKSIFQKKGFIAAPMHMHAENTLQLNLEASLEKIMANMRKSTRYSIRRAKRDGVKIKRSKNLEDIDKLYELQLKTAQRHDFVPFPKKNFKEEFSVFNQDDQAILFLAKYKGEVLVVSMIVYYGDTAVYHYSGSSLNYRQVPASHLVQWEAIKEAKKRGCQIYNFWGIAPTDDSDHRFAGVTFFKQGFGGKRVDYLHAMDLPIKKRYWLTWLFETLRRKKRHL